MGRACDDGEAELVVRAFEVDVDCFGLCVDWASPSSFCVDVGFLSLSPLSSLSSLSLPLEDLPSAGSLVGEGSSLGSIASSPDEMTSGISSSRLLNSGICGCVREFSFSEMSLGGLE